MILIYAVIVLLGDGRFILMIVGAFIHYDDVIISAMAFQMPHDCLLNRLFRRISKEHQSSALLAFVQGIHRSHTNGPNTDNDIPRGNDDEQGLC